MANTGKWTVHYFNATGRAELIRWMLAYAKADWEDKRYEGKDWPSVKDSMPMKQMPVVDLECSDGNKVKMSQTAAIVHMLARKLGLDGQTDCQAAMADECFEALREVQEHMFRMHFEKDEEKKKEMMEKAMKDHLPRIFGYLENRLKANGSKNLVGSENYTYADVFVGSMFDLLVAKSPSGVDLKAMFPELSGLAKKIEECDGVKEYLEKRPKTSI